MQGIELTEQSFRERVLDASKKKPVLVEFGGEWCPDCRVLDDMQVLEAIALLRLVNVVKFEVPREKAVQEYYLHNPSEARAARKEGKTVNTSPRLEGVSVLLRRDVNVRAYPTILLFDQGKPQAFYAAEPDPNVQQHIQAGSRRDRITDSDLVEGPRGAKVLRQGGMQALTESIRWYTANRRSH